MGLNPLNLYLEILTIAVIDMDIESSQNYFGVNRDEIINKLKPNFEGKIMLKPYCRKMLNHYQNAYLSAPALKQILQVILSDYEHINTSIGLSI
jgi:hypothetical protein